MESHDLSDGIVTKQNLVSTLPGLCIQGAASPTGFLRPGSHGLRTAVSVRSRFKHIRSPLGEFVIANFAKVLRSCEKSDLDSNGSTGTCGAHKEVSACLNWPRFNSVTETIIF